MRHMAAGSESDLRATFREAGLDRSAKDWAQQQTCRVRVLEPPNRKGSVYAVKDPQSPADRGRLTLEFRTQAMNRMRLELPLRGAT